MWEPQDKYAMPHAEDTSRARKTIGRLQMDMCAAGNLLPAGEVYFRSLLQRLEDTWAWIAPVRRIPFEILSSVFTLAAEEEWRAPLRIASVCHSWRDVVLATPQAWTFIDLRDFPKAETFSTFIGRSGRCPLHLTVPFRASQEYYPVMLSRITYRIQCLVVTSTSMNLLLEGYQNLTRLAVDNYVFAAVPLDYLDISRLPNLCYFEGSFSKAGIVRNVASSQTFPRLENMVVTTDPQSAWIDAVRACSRTLTGLHIFVGDRPPFQPAPTIQLPRLKRLAIGSRWNSHPHWRFTAKTPALDMYSFNVDPEKHSINVDLETITHLECRICIPLDPFPNLRFLRMLCRKSQGLLMLDQLRRDHNQCVTLERIELATWEELDTRQLNRNLRRRNNSTKVDLKVEHIDCEASWVGNIKVSCGKNMPCNV